MAFKPEIIKGGNEHRMSQISDLKKDIIADSKIEEEKIFTRGEILGLIEQIAKEENIKPDQLRLLNEKYDEQGNLVCLSVEVKKGRALGEGWKDMEYDFIIKGTHGQAGFSNTSVVCKSYNSSDPGTDQGGIVGEYIDGKWVISPGRISPKAESFKLKE